MSIITLQTNNVGANPFQVDVVQASGSGIILPQFKLGTVAYGDASSEMVYCKYVSVSNQVLKPGLLFTIDDDFTATLLTTSNSPRGSAVYVSVIGCGNYGASFTTVTGTTYYFWLVRAGQVPVTYTTIATAGNLAETTATGGALNMPNSATVSSKLIVGLYATKGTAPATFSGTTTNGSTFVSVLPGAITIDKGPAWIGSTLSATGIASSQTIVSFSYLQPDVINGFTLSAAATASGTVTITPTLVQEMRMYWPYIDKTN